MLKPFNLESPKAETFVFIKVDGETQKYKVETSDYFEARLSVINHLDQGFKRHGAVLALIE